MGQNRPALPMEGGCSCGAIRYRIASFPLLLYACHCTGCQTACGSAFALNMPVRAKDFHILQGEPKPWRHSSPTEVALASWFCGDCGARLYGEGASTSSTSAPATLDDTSWLQPIAHFFMTSAQDWMRSAAIAECHETTGLADVLPLAAAWRANWPDFFTTSLFS